MAAFLSQYVGNYRVLRCHHLVYHKELKIQSSNLQGALCMKWVEEKHFMQGLGTRRSRKAEPTECCSIHQMPQENRSLHT